MSRWQNVGVLCGVAAGIWLAVWFSTVVAMGPAPGQRQAAQESQRTKPKNPYAPDVLGAIKDQPPAPKYTPDCEKGDKRDDCFLQWRATTAAEAQARYTKDHAWYAWFGSLLIFATLLATAGATVAAAVSAKASCRAAKAAEKAITELERPQVFVEVSSPGLEVNLSDGRFELAGHRFEHKCVNYGRTTALLIEYLPKILILEAGAFPAPVGPKTERGRELPVGCVAAEGNPYTEGDTSMKTFDLKLLEAGASRKYRVYFVGYIRYADIFGARYINGFCSVYDPIGGRFVRRGNNQNYNYSRKEDAKPIGAP
jgi:hypothetical protein